jgi:hypothetical protein
VETNSILDNKRFSGMIVEDSIEIFYASQTVTAKLEGVGTES